MKRKCVFILCGVLLLLSGCSAEDSEKTSIPTPPPEIKFDNVSEIDISAPVSTTAIDEITWEYAINEFPHSTYEEVKSGAYPNQYVILSCVIENAEYFEPMDWVECDVWFSYRDIYKADDIRFDCAELTNCSPKKLQPGDNIDICIYVNADNSFGGDIISFSENANTVTLSEIHDCVPVDFIYYGKVPNDSTGKWRLSKANTNLNASEYALFYYSYYFESDNEIHAIVNYQNNTTIRICANFGMLDVSVLTHIEGEENDAKMLFGGSVIESYQVDISSGEILNISE